MVIFPVYICKRCLSLQWRLWMLVVGVEWCKKLVPRALGGGGGCDGSESIYIETIKMHIIKTLNKTLKTKQL